MGCRNNAQWTWKKKNGYLRAPNEEEEDIVDDIPTKSSASRHEAFVSNIIKSNVTRPQYNCEQNTEYYDNNIEIV